MSTKKRTIIPWDTLKRDQDEDSTFPSIIELIFSKFSQSQWKPWKKPISANKERKAMNPNETFKFEFTVLTHNVLFDVVDDSKFFTRKRIPMIIDEIIKLKPDVVGLQEVTVSILQYIKDDDRIRKYYIISDIDGKFLVPYGNLVLLKKKKMHPDMCTLTRYSPFKQSPNICFQLRNPKTTNCDEYEQLQFQFVHLSAGDKHGTRRNQIRQAVENAEETNHLIMAGDFNFSDEYDDMGVPKEYKDCWLEFNDLKINPGYTYDPEQNYIAKLNSTSKIRRRLDRIFYKSNGKFNLSCKDIQIIGKEKLIFTDESKKTYKGDLKFQFVLCGLVSSQSESILSHFWNKLQSTTKLEREVIDGLFTMTENIYLEEEFIQEPVTQTTILQDATHKKVFRLLDPYYKKLKEFPSEQSNEQKEFIEKFVVLYRDLHIKYCLDGLTKELPEGFISLDASRAWIIYWLVHSLTLMGIKWEAKENENLRKDIIQTIKAHQQSTGGFAGGVQCQMSHLAPTYASVNALIEIGTVDAYDVIDREALRSFLLSLKVDGGRGGVRMHHGGEVDVRGVYCLLSSATLAGILDDELAEGLDEFVRACQSYEGGISAYPGTEAHGGYTYCGLAAMMILKKQDTLDLDALALWNSRRQMEGEGGFQGRTFKVVDVCYSLWIGGVFPLIEGAFAGRMLEITKEQQKIYELLQWRPTNFDRQILVPGRNNKINSAIKFEKVKIEVENEEDITQTLPKDQGLPGDDHLFNQVALQEYILLCCQSIRGGLIDKPGRGPDFYHTCYALSGLSVAQHNSNGTTSVLGNPSNLLCKINPIFNVAHENAKKALKYFSNKEYL